MDRMGDSTPTLSADVELLGPAHAAELQFLAADPAIAATTRIPHPYPAGAAKEFVELQLKERAEGRAFVFAIKAGQVVVGVCGLHGIARNEAEELGYWVGQKYWGRGYASTAVKRVLEFGFEQLKLRLIGSMALESNRVSRRVLVKNGFQLLRIAPQRDPRLKQPGENHAIYELTRNRWCDGQGGGAPVK